MATGNGVSSLESRRDWFLFIARRCEKRDFNNQIVNEVQYAIELRASEGITRRLRPRHARRTFSSPGTWGEFAFILECIESPMILSLFMSRRF